MSGSSSKSVNDIVSELVEKHDLNGKSGSKPKSECWKRIAQEFNEENQSEFGIKTVKQLQNGWNNHLSRLKEKMSKIKAESKKTGGGTMPKNLKLTEEEQRHLCIGNAVNKTYESQFDSDCAELGQKQNEKKEVSKAKKTKKRKSFLVND